MKIRKSQWKRQIPATCCSTGLSATGPLFYGAIPPTYVRVLPYPFPSTCQGSHHTSAWYIPDSRISLTSCYKAFVASRMLNFGAETLPCISIIGQRGTFIYFFAAVSPCSSWAHGSYFVQHCAYEQNNSNHILSSEILKAFVASRTAQVWNREVSPHTNGSMWQFYITFLLGLPRGFVGRCIHRQHLRHFQ